jgi:cytochrome c-type biogenesis protein CcmH
MMGWGMLILAALGVAALLVLLRFPKGMWTIPATAVTLAAAGYAWQGNPGLEGHPASAKKQGREVDPALIAMREAMFGRFGFESQYFGAADAMMRNGSPDLAARVMIGGVAKAPEDAALWTWLGVTLSESERGLVSPAARQAFDRAIELAPKHPGPPYFLGLMLTRSGQYAETRKLWVKAVELAPEKMSYRAALVEQLARLDEFLGSQGVVPNSPPAERGGAGESMPPIGLPDNSQALP